MKCDSEANDQRVRHILDMVAKGTFTPGRSHRMLAEKWGVHPKHVSDLVTQAFRFVRLTRDGRIADEIERKLAQLEADRRAALKLQKHVVVNGEVRFYRSPDCKAAIQATRVYLEVIGAMGRRTSKPVKPGSDLSLEELRQKREAVRTALGDLEAEIQRQEEQQH